MSERSAPRWKKAAGHVLKWVLFAHLAFWGLILVFCLAYDFINPPFTSLAIYRRVFYGYRGEPMTFVRLSELPRAAAQMTVIAEDNTFWRHWGIEPSAILEAAKRNRRLGYSMFGGSTINQQLARTLFLWPKKWMIRKYLEGWIAMEMNILMPKKRILEIYLNRVEWGKGIYGIDAASRHYYGKSARKLTRDEVRDLITILPNPLRYTPFDAGQSRLFRERYALLSRSLDASHSSSDHQTPALTELLMSNAQAAATNGAIPVVPEILIPDNSVTDAAAVVSNADGGNLPSSDEETH